ncbi:hypothetical protein ACETK8_20420 (plasmid) [Brevundimonas staleyi]|uniref:Uncharacterized protein n=1 Tax=Brevundimonas staleyi TaxID=74326 RepID=A0ABW0FNU3_9CAUL
MQNSLYSAAKPTMTQHRSTLERPAERLIQKFDVWQVKDRSIRSLLAKGYSLAICCKQCPRMIEWTPQELLQKFEGKLDVQLADLVPRLSCTGEEGCGSREVAVFPHLYEGEWRWPPT